MTMIYSPLEQFEVTPVWSLALGDTFALTNTGFFGFIVMFAIFAVLSFGTTNATIVPNRWQTLVEGTFEFVLTMARDTVTGGKAENFEYVLGEGRMLPEFEAATLGLKPGESKSFPLSFPADYHGKDVAGKTAEFTITVKSVNWGHLPAVDDAFALSMGVTEGVAKMREEVKENLVREVKRRITSLLKNEVMEKLNTLCELDVPKSLVASEQERMVEGARQDLMQRGVPNAKDAPIPAELFAEQANKRVRLGLILSELVKKHNLAVTADQIKAEIDEQAATYEDPKEVVRWFYSNPSRLKDIENLVLEDNVIKHFTSLAKVSDKAISFEELSKLN